MINIVLPRICIRVLSLFMLMLLSLFLSVCIVVEAAEPSERKQPIFTANFDNGSLNELKDELFLEKHGGKLISNGIIGGALSLGKEEYLVLNAPRLMHSEEGTLMFWVRPHWGEEDGESHTFLSLQWDEPRGGYFVVSKGWWEPQGARLTYFISNNQNFSHVSKEIRYEQGRWTHVACSWKAGKEGFVRLYINGILAGEKRIINKKDNFPSKRIFLGSDQGTSLASKRWADADFDEIATFPSAFSAEEVLTAFEVLQPYKARGISDANGKLLEMRAIFDEGVGWTTEEGARRTIERIKRAGFNVYIPCVWHGAGARFPTNKVAIEGNRQFGNKDPLARLIDIAHKQGVQVHPWFTVALRQREIFPEFHPLGSPLNAFDLHRPGFQQFIVSLIVDVVKRYPVDGINLDFIRTMGICLCDKCSIEYLQKYGRDLATDSLRTNPYGVLEEISLQVWQDEAVEKIVRDVSFSVRAVRPNAIISVDGHPTPNASAEGRSEVRWANLGIVDFIFDMAYGDAPDVETPNLMRSRIHDPNRLVLLVNNYQQVGKKVIPKDPIWLTRVVTYVRRRWGNGIGVYLYSMLSDAQIDELARGPFAAQAHPCGNENIGKK